jgi:hypothetical protein
MFSGIPNELHGQNGERRSDDHFSSNQWEITPLFLGALYTWANQTGTER